MIPDFKRSDFESLLYMVSHLASMTFFSLASRWSLFSSALALANSSLRRRARSSFSCLKQKSKTFQLCTLKTKMLLLAVNYSTNTGLWDFFKHFLYHKPNMSFVVGRCGPVDLIVNKFTTAPRDLGSQQGSGLVTFALKRTFIMTLVTLL